MVLEAINHDVIFDDVMLKNQRIISPLGSPSLENHEDYSELVTYKKSLEVPQDVSSLNSLTFSQEKHQFIDEGNIEDLMLIEFPLFGNQMFVNQLDEIDNKNQTEKIMTVIEDSNKFLNPCCGKFSISPEKSIQSPGKENNLKDLIPVVGQLKKMVETSGKNPISIVPYGSSESESDQNPDDEGGISEASNRRAAEINVNRMKIERQINQTKKFSSSESDSDQKPDYNNNNNNIY
ncbi:uncharacterized protein LOC123673482 [Harmonia axyridis]|uniref:uncharacterized protein LOC123673482 n=1 Tax=Harmonia axyridis TaxID=115357 RepID=UPI001E277763|nr:uncharacterized protein LOC123673482 [Harmonia axyridis]